MAPLPEQVPYLVALEVSFRLVSSAASWRHYLRIGTVPCGALPVPLFYTQNEG